MKRLLLFTILFTAILFLVAGCSKDDDVNPKADFTGTWKVTTESSVYLNSDGSSFRDEYITEDDVNTDPDYEVVITDEVILVEGESLTYDLSDNSFTFKLEGETMKFDYTIKGDNMTWKNTQLNRKIEYDGTVYTTIPKQVTTVSLTRK